jgi:hypothetical protein
LFFCFLFFFKPLKKALPWGKRAPVASLPGAHGELDR